MIGILRQAAPSRNAAPEIFATGPRASLVGLSLRPIQPSVELHTCNYEYYRVSWCSGDMSPFGPKRTFQVLLSRNCLSGTDGGGDQRVSVLLTSCGRSF